MHTPTPWHVNELLPSGKHVNSGYGPIAVTITSEDAAFIVTACNAHDALVAAGQAIVEESNQMLAIRQGTDDPVSDARLFDLIEQLRPLLAPEEAMR